MLTSQRQNIDILTTSKLRLRKVYTSKQRIDIPSPFMRRVYNQKWSRRRVVHDLAAHHVVHKTSNEGVLSARMLQHAASQAWVAGPSEASVPHTVARGDASKASLQEVLASQTSTPTQLALNEWHEIYFATTLYCCSQRHLPETPNS